MSYAINELYVFSSELFQFQFQYQSYVRTLDESHP